jgi:hypothetical protein
MVNQNLAHDVGGHANEMSATAKVRLILLLGHQSAELGSLI